MDRIDSYTLEVAAPPVAVKLLPLGPAFDPLDDNEPVGGVAMDLVANSLSFSAPVSLRAPPPPK